MANSWYLCEMFLISEEKVLHVTPQLIDEIGKRAYVQEFIYVAETLYGKGIEAKVLLIPTIEELKELSLVEEIMNKQLISFPKVTGLHNTKLETFFLKRFLEIEDNEEVGEIPEQEFVHPQILGNGDATIYLIGPCIVEGSTYLESASLAYILEKKCADKSWRYKICRIVVPVMSMNVQQIVEELDITESDRVFFICSSYSHSMSERCIDMLPIYNERKQDEMFFADYPLHTLRAGNEAIAECIISYMDKIETKNKRKNYLQVGVPRLSMREKNELYAYMKRIKVNNELEGGAIVMNANPFTLGHLHLIEKAASQVALLYIFVVQEDFSEFRFDDRFQLVKEGTEHLKNVRVVPSGSFILSRHTMSAYFEKESLQESRADVSKDVALFGGYVAPALSINVRFVGEEPFDYVTRQYNEEMKIKLPLYGIRVVEIARADVEGRVISASVVRSLFQEKKWNELRKMLPEVTYRFLRTNPIMRDKKALIYNKLENKTMLKQECIFAQNDKVVFYPAGQSSKEKFEKLSDEKKRKISFADIKALQDSYMFCGKEVLSPLRLLDELKEVPIMITSINYQAEICRYLFGLGINLDRMNLF